MQVLSSILKIFVVFMKSFGKPKMVYSIPLSNTIINVIKCYK